MKKELSAIKREMIENRLLLPLNDKKLFGNDTGEHETEDVLLSYFLEVNDSDDFYDEKNPISIASARKGMGKSALLSKLYYKLKADEAQKNNLIVIRVTGNDLLGLGDFTDKDEAYLENYWKQIISKKINLEIGSRIKFALSGDAILLVENAELENMKEKNFIGSLLDRFSTKISTLDIEFEIKEGRLPQDWKNILATYQKKHENSFIWLLIDDIDAKFLNNQIYQDRISSFFTAISSLATTVNRLNIRATVRTDVWNSINHIEDLDKYEQYLFEIYWTKTQMRDMLAKRVLSYIQRYHPEAQEASYSYSTDYTKILNLVFAKQINWNNEQKDFYEPILIYSNKRPRWMGQLCRLAAKEAYKAQRTIISERNLLEAMGPFGKLRISDFKKEHSHQFEYIEQLIDAFRAGKRSYNLDELLEQIHENFLSIYGNLDTIDGCPYSDVKQIGKFLYKIVFISTREESVYITFDDKPDLFDSIQNTQNHIRWEIHPTYRKYLEIR